MTENITFVSTVKYYPLIKTPEGELSPSLAEQIASIFEMYKEEFGVEAQYIMLTPEKDYVYVPHPRMMHPPQIEGHYYATGYPKPDDLAG